MGVFLFLITFFNPELRERTKIQHDLVSFHIIENDLFEKQKQNKTFYNEQFKIFRRYLIDHHRTISHDFLY